MHRLVGWPAEATHRTPATHSSPNMIHHGLACFRLYFLSLRTSLTTLLVVSYFYPFLCVIYRWLDIRSWANACSSIFDILSFIQHLLCVIGTGASGFSGLWYPLAKYSKVVTSNSLSYLFSAYTRVDLEVFYGIKHAKG